MEISSPTLTLPHDSQRCLALGLASHLRGLVPKDSIKRILELDTSIRSFETVCAYWRTAITLKALSFCIKGALIAVIYLDLSLFAILTTFSGTGVDHVLIDNDLESQRSWRLLR